MIKQFKIDGDFFLTEKVIFYKSENNLKVIDENGSESIFLTFEHPFAIHSVYQGSLIVSTPNQFTLVNIDNGKTQTVFLSEKSSFQLKFWNSDSIVVRPIIQQGDSGIIKMNFDAKRLWQLEFTEPFFCTLCSDIFLIHFFKANSIIACSYETGEIKWRRNLSDLISGGVIYQSTKLLCIGNSSYFDFRSTYKSGIVELDVVTGEEKAFINSQSTGFLTGDGRHVYTFKSPNTICIIDPFNGKVNEWDVTELIKNNGFMSISDYRTVAVGGLLIFKQTLGDKVSKAGMLDTRNKELIWKYEFKPQNGGIRDIQVSDNRLCIQTQDQILHVFELFSNYL